MQTNSVSFEKFSNKRSYSAANMSVKGSNGKDKQTHSKNFGRDRRAQRALKRYTSFE